MVQAMVVRMRIIREISRSKRRAHGAADSLGQLGDAAKAGAQSGGKNHPSAGPLITVQPAKPMFRTPPNFFLHLRCEPNGGRFAGERRIVDHQPIGGDNTQVGGNLVALGHHIAGNDLGGRQAADPAVSAYFDQMG